MLQIQMVSRTRRGVWQSAGSSLSATRLRDPAKTRGCRIAQVNTASRDCAVSFPLAARGFLNNGLKLGIPFLLYQLDANRGEEAARAGLLIISGPAEVTRS